MKKIVTLFLILVNLSICSSYGMGMPKVKPDNIKLMQTRDFASNNSERVMQAVIGTLQDSDYIIQDYDPELGFIRASKTFKTHFVNKKRVAGWSAALALATAYTVFSYGSTAASMYSPTRRVANEMKDKTVVVDCNVFIENLGDKTQVRFIPVAKVLQNADGFGFFNNAPVKIWRIYKPKIYEEFFAQVNKNLW